MVSQFPRRKRDQAEGDGEWEEGLRGLTRIFLSLRYRSGPQLGERKSLYTAWETGFDSSVQDFLSPER